MPTVPLAHGISPVSIERFHFFSRLRHGPTRRQPQAAETSANKALAYVRSCRQQIFASQCVLDATRVANAALNDAEKAARDGFFAIQTALAARDGAKSVARHAALAAYYSAKAAKTCFEDIKSILTLYRRTFFENVFLCVTHRSIPVF